MLPPNREKLRRGPFGPAPGAKRANPAVLLERLPAPAASASPAAHLPSASKSLARSYGNGNLRGEGAAS